MRSQHTSFASKVLASFVFLASGILCNTALAQIPNHMLEFKKQVFGTNGDPANPVAQVGEKVTCIISFQNKNDRPNLDFPIPGTYTLSSIVDVIHHANGDESITNLFIPPLTLTPDTILNGVGSFVIITNFYIVRLEDKPLGFLTDDARAFGFDDHNDVPGDIPLPFVPFQSAPAQIRILGGEGPCVDKVCEAVSDRYNPGGSDHALWMPGISTNLIFSPTPGSWVENSNGSADLTGMVHSRTNVNCGFNINVHFTGKTLNAPSDSPKHDPSNDPPADTSKWYYYTAFTGTLTGFGPCWEGAILDIVRNGASWQVGIGANLKNINFGASGWFTWTVTHQRNAGPPLPITGKGDFNIDIKPCLPPCPTCVVRYPFSTSGNPRTSVVFNESEVLRAFSGGAVSFGDTIKVWYNDEHALALGVKEVKVKTSSGTMTTPYAVTPLVSNPGGEFFPLVGATALTGDQAGTDVSGRPLYPALFITDVTSDPLSMSGDWQFGGTPISPHAVYGTWKAAIRTVDKTVSPTRITLTMDSDPAQNHWNLGAGSDPAPDNVLSDDEGYGAEVVWNVSDLQAFDGLSFGPLKAGHSYRLQFMVHDGDQTKTGGDVGQNCVTVCIPPNTPAPIALALRVRALELMPSGVSRLIIMGISGRSYLIECSEDLTLWRSIATVLNNNNGVLQFSDPGRTSRCFYRVKLLP